MNWDTTLVVNSVTVNCQSVAHVYVCILIKDNKNHCNWEWCHHFFILNAYKSMQSKQKTYNGGNSLIWELAPT